MAEIVHHSIEWPYEDVVEWDDLDYMSAELIHEHWCKRWPHRLARRLTRKGQHASNRWVRRLAWWLEGGFDPNTDPHRGGWVWWIEEACDSDGPRGDG